jgi:hypothetical protein
MALFAQKQIEEINAIIEKIEKEIKPNCEIGAREKVLLRTILKTNKVDRVAKFFPCKREYSDAIVSHFVNEKGLIKNKFSSMSQANVFLLY